MRNKAVSLILTCLVIMCSVCGITTAGTDTVSEVQNLADGILSYKTGGQGVQDWINNYFPSNADSVEWYAIALSQSGDYDFTQYRTALENYVQSENITSATARQKYALALRATGSNSDYIAQTAENSIGQLGIMSYIYGLHLLNNGLGSDAEDTVNKLLSMQLPDGGWAVIGEYGDVDVTAMALHALASARQYSGVNEAVERGIGFLSEKQLDDGGFKSMGNENPESSAQVITALSALNIDCLLDSRFVKNGNNMIDAMCMFRLGDGSFCHSPDGGSNETATVQAYYSLVAYLRMTRGQGALFMLDPKAETPPDAVQVSAEELQSYTAEYHEEHVEEPENVQADESENNSESEQEQTAETVQTTIAVSKPVDPINLTTVTTSGTSTMTSKITSAVTTVSACCTSTSVTSATSVPVFTMEATGTPHKKGSYRTVAVIAVCSAGLIAVIILLIKKRKLKSYIMVVVLTASAVAVILLTDIQSKEDYYKEPEKSAVTGTVTMTIRCDTVAELAGIDPVILDVTEFSIEDGDTVFDVLNDACKTYGIQAENTGSAGNAHGMVYIAGINNLYEFDWGELSGWMYFVNGEECSVGCGDYVLSDGDSIQWLYTREIGKDLEVFHN